MVWGFFFCANNNARQPHHVGGRALLCQPSRWREPPRRRHGAKENATRQWVAFPRMDAIPLTQFAPHQSHCLLRKSSSSACGMSRIFQPPPQMSPCATTRAPYSAHVSTACLLVVSHASGTPSR